MEFRVAKIVNEIEGFDAVPAQTVKMTDRKYLVPDVAVQRAWHRWGVNHCWLIDPEKRQCWEYPADGNPRQVPQGGQITAGDFVLNLGDLFAGF